MVQCIEAGRATPRSPSTSLSVPWEQSTRLRDLLQSGKLLPQESRYFKGHQEACLLLEDIEQHHVCLSFGNCSVRVVNSCDVALRSVKFTCVHKH